MKKSILTREAAAKLIRSTNGKIFSCDFIKKDGSSRRMVARLGTHTKLRGGVSTIKGKSNLIGCYDMQSQGYRCINVDTLVSLRTKGQEYKVEG